jgi:hypothetical protein
LNTILSCYRSNFEYLIVKINLNMLGTWELFEYISLQRYLKTIMVVIVTFWDRVNFKNATSSCIRRIKYFAIAVQIVYIALICKFYSSFAIAVHISSFLIDVQIYKFGIVIKISKFGIFNVTPRFGNTTDMIETSLRSIIISWT